MNRPRTMAVTILAVPIASCGRTPVLNISGSFFPSWMLCAIGGLLFPSLMNRAFKA